MINASILTMFAGISDAFPFAKGKNFFKQMPLSTSATLQTHRRIQDQFFSAHPRLPSEPRRTSPNLAEPPGPDPHLSPRAPIRLRPFIQGGTGWYGGTVVPRGPKWSPCLFGFNYFKKFTPEKAVKKTPLD